MEHDKTDRTRRTTTAERDSRLSIPTQVHIRLCARIEAEPTDSAIFAALEHRYDNLTLDLSLVGGEAGDDGIPALMRALRFAASQARST